ncbi:phosphatase PAP2 family protein [Streptomyces sp. NPDC090080]|uniref:phosphatase PAP2 family protein n=1 Tax=Streptomyces sp. NPDC090080 TaxID=3365939 RepID=UPI00380FE28C
MSTPHLTTASGTVSSADRSGFHAIYDFAHSHPPLQKCAELWSEYGLSLFVLLLVFNLWLGYRRGTRQLAAAVTVILAGFVALGGNNVIKAAVAEARPCQVDHSVEALGGCPLPGDYSFMSTHTVAAASIAIGTLYISRRAGRLACLGTVLMCASRIMIGMHWPGDVVAGLVFGGVVAAAGQWLLTPLLDRLFILMSGARLPLVKSSPPDAQR